MLDKLAERIYNLARYNKSWSPFSKLDEKEKDYWRGRAQIAKETDPAYAATLLVKR